jgi:hypothetical protein
MNAFARIAAESGSTVGMVGTEKDFITSLDINTFLKNNGIIMSESDCFLLVA